MGKHIGQQYFRQGFNLQNIWRTQTTQCQEDKQSNVNMGKGDEQTFFQGGCAEDP